VKVLDYLEKNGCYGRAVSIDHLEELREQVKALHGKGLLDESYYIGSVAPRLEPKEVRGMSKARSIFVTSIPSPAIRTRFHWKGEEIELTIPPTYDSYVSASNRSRQLLKEAFASEKHWIARAILPIKLLAVRSGLAKYGRNNVTYIPKCGSFHTLSALYTDYESPEDHWQEMEALPKCATCRACMKACPTGAISEDRFLIRVEKCLTYFSEMPASKPFPEWISPSAHNSLVGCMRCQRACPYNKDLIDWHRNAGNFTEEETAYLLKGEFKGAKAKAMDRKLKRIGLDLSIFPRNLEVHIRKIGLLP
jgi:epoxyqueuosine reductase